MAGKKSSRITTDTHQTDFQPVRLAEIELSQPLHPLNVLDETSGSCYQRARLFIRLCAQPVGFVDIDLDHDLSADELAYLIWQALSGPINAFLRKLGAPLIDRLTGSGIVVPAHPLGKDTQEAFFSHAPSICVIVCTRDRSEALDRCLQKLLTLDYPNYEILVVDNAPKTDQTEILVKTKYGSNPRVRYTREDHPGLAWARNCGLAKAQSEIVAYIDDDELADHFWLAELAKGFGVDQQVACVTGLILPAELETQSQYWFEQYGGHSKGRGFEQIVFNTRNHHTQSPLFPNPPFGAGGNMAFKTETLRALGGFDAALGAGTKALGGEDTAAFYRVLTRGHSLVIAPAAFVRHFHYREYAGLRKQFYGYGVGLTAFYMHCLLDDPRHIFEIIREIPKGLRFFFHRKADSGNREAPIPGDLIKIKLIGLLKGPFAYWQSRRELNRIIGKQLSRTIEMRPL